MKKYIIILTILSNSAIAEELPVFKVDEKGINNTVGITDFTFMEVKVMNKGKLTNDKFFIGPLPEVGQSVEMVYVGSREDGAMRFQLKVKQ